jgi:hypothetical protein
MDVRRKLSRQEQPSGLADGRAGLIFVRCEVPAGEIAISAKPLHHMVLETISAVDGRLRYGEYISVYFVSVRSSQSVYDSISLVPWSAVYGIFQLQQAVAQPTCA